jgi:hypothetical protein
VNHLPNSRAEIALFASLISWFRAAQLFFNLTLIAVRNQGRSRCDANNSRDATNSGHLQQTTQELMP